MDRETLNAFVDGELPPREMARIAALLEGQPELKAYVLKQEKLRAALRFENLMMTAPPASLVETVQAAPVSWRWRLRAVLGRRFVVRSLVPATATLLAGLIIGLTLQSSGDLVQSQGQMLARGNLAQALDTKLASSGYS